VQTPEGFKKDDLTLLYEKYELNESIFDESILLEKEGIAIKVVSGSFENN